jgi:hypothetical protein
MFCIENKMNRENADGRTAAGILDVLRAAPIARPATAGAGWRSVRK